MKNIIASLVLLVLMVGCARSGNYVNIVQSNYVQREFAEAKVRADYNYYYNGPENNPIGIVGLDKDIVLTSKYWHAFDLTEERMAYLYSNIRDDWFIIGTRPIEGNMSSGSNIFSPSGEKIGVLFMKYKRIVAKFTGPKTLSLTNPIKTRNNFRWTD